MRETKPSKTKKVGVSIRLPAETFHRLKQIAAEQHRSLNGQIVAILEAVVDEGSDTGSAS